MADSRPVNGTGAASAVPAAPAELRSRHQWVCWSLADRTTKTGEVKPTKVLRQVSGANAASDNPATWTTFEDACAAADRFDGIGFVFSADDPYTGIDLDAVVDSATGELHPAADEILEQLDSYAEKSPSGTGVHVIVRASKNGFPRSSTAKTPWKAKVEIYDERRFFTWTGVRLNDRGIEPRQQQLDQLLAQIWPNENGRTGEAPHGRRARRTTPRTAGPGVNGMRPDDGVLDRWLAKPRFRAAYERPATDQSERDYELANIAMEHGADDAEAARVMQAARGDAKAYRADYVERTIARVRENQQAKASADLEELGFLLGVDVRAVTVYGRGSNAVVYIHLTGSGLVVLDTLGRCASVGKLGVELAIQAGAEPKLTAANVNRILALFHRLGQRVDEHEREDQAADHGFTFLRAAHTEVVRMADQADRWRAFGLLDRTDPVATARLDSTSVAAASVVLEDIDNGIRYVRIAWLKAYVRQQTGEAEQTARAMLRVGWTKPGRDGQIKATAPGHKQILHWAFFTVPKGWEER